jgi:hypothetical protein
LKLVILGVIVAACISTSLACTGVGLSKLRAEGPGTFESYLLRSPLIVVGTVRSAEQLGWRNPFTEGGTIVLFRIRARVENVLKGEFGLQDIDIYSFLEAGSHEGPETMAFGVDRRYVFYLRKQNGRWRTACDVSEDCIDRVLSGYHGTFKTDPTHTLADDILRLLLTRGDNASDGSMVDALGRSDATIETEYYASRWRRERKDTYVRILRQTSETATPPLRAEACVLLRELDQPCDLCANEKAEGKQGPK